MQRPKFEKIYMNLAKELAQRSTCKRLSVGCVITSLDYQRVLAIGYNGNAAGLPNECDSDEPGKCGCIHAENNAIIKCADHYADKIVFCTHQPCKMCAKQLVNLGGVKLVYYDEPYRLKEGIQILQDSEIDIVQLGIEVTNTELDPT